MEWVKLASLRSTWWTLGITIAAAAGIAVPAAAGTKTTPSQDLTNSMMTGMFAGVLLAGVLGVLAVTSEYTSGTIRATLAAAPRRPLVLAAKAAVFGVMTLITGQAAAFLAFFAGRTALGHGIAAPALGQPGVLRTIVLSGASLALIGLLGLGLGAIIRHTAAAVTVLVGVVYAGELFIGQLDRTIDAYLPAYIVGDSLGGHTCRPGAAACPLPAWAGMSVLAAYAAATLLIGGCILARRDA
jgi:ABC-type transport system involved in multi-copper enzyme maturation permease subunit